MAWNGPLKPLLSFEMTLSSTKCSLSSTGVTLSQLATTLSDLKGALFTQMERALPSLKWAA